MPLMLAPRVLRMLLIWPHGVLLLQGLLLHFLDGIDMWILVSAVHVSAGLVWDCFAYYGAWKP